MAGRPWELYGGGDDDTSSSQPQQPSTGGGRPWELYGGGPEPTVGVQHGDDTTDTGVDTLTDVGKAIPSGLAKGTIGLLSAPGDIGSLVRAGATKLGVPDTVINAGATMARLNPVTMPFTLPGSQQVRKGVEETLTGPLYDPQTRAGKYASTIAEFAPSAVLPGGGGAAARVVNTVLPAVASETAGQYYEGHPIEPSMRMMGGILGGVAGARAITPVGPSSTARMADVATLDAAGIPLTASQRTGSTALKWLEGAAGDMFGGAGIAARNREAQSEALNRAITDRTFNPDALAAELTTRGQNPAEVLPNPRAMAAGRQTLSNEYTRLTNANDLVGDQPLYNDILNAENNYLATSLPSQRAAGAKDISQIREDIANALIAGGGRMPGPQYQQIRSRLGSQAKESTGSLANTLGEFQGALDRAMQRGLPPDEARAWALNNTRWGNMKQLEQAAVTAKDNQFSPAALAASVRSGRKTAAASGRGDLDELTRAIGNVLPPPPQSGTAPRLNMITNIGQLGAGAAGLVLGNPALLAGAVAPVVGARAVHSYPVQRYLGNRVLPQQSRDVLARTLQEQASNFENDRTDQNNRRLRITVNPAGAR